MATHFRILTVLCLTAFLGACASSNSGGGYSRGQTRQVQTVKMGTVESVRLVKIEGTGSPVGTGAGAVIGPGDVELRQSTADASAESLTRLEDVVGQEAVRSLPLGQVMTRELVRSPILVKRGDPVTVYARAAGIQIRTTARARDEGGQGDLITVESMLNRQMFFARVTGWQEVEVYARPIEAATAAGGKTGEATP